jgi:hypothetical protein
MPQWDLSLDSWLRTRTGASLWLPFAASLQPVSPPKHLDEVASRHDLLFFCRMSGEANR